MNICHVHPFSVNVEQQVRETGNEFTRKQGLFNVLSSQTAFTFSKSAMEKQEQSAKYNQS